MSITGSFEYKDSSRDTESRRLESQVQLSVKMEFAVFHLLKLVKQLFKGFNLGYTLDVILQ